MIDRDTIKLYYSKLYKLNTSMESTPTFEIDLDIIKYNYNKLQHICSSSVSGVLKANAYGLGATKIAEKIYNENCRDFFVANLDEAIDLRKHIKNADIYVLNGVMPGQESYFVEHNIIPVISDLYQLDLLKKYKVQKKIALHFDTGMNRYAIPYEQSILILNQKDILSGFDVKLVMSHLSSAGVVDDIENIKQLEKFKEISSHFKHAKKSLANSEGIMISKDYHFDLVRPGAAIYGLRLNNAMSVFSNPVRLFVPLIQIKNVHKGMCIGYNHTYKFKNDSIVGTVPVGYADGIFRSLSNKGYFNIAKQRVPIIGRVSMDLINIDLTNLDERYRKIGQEVDVISDLNRPDEVSKLCNTAAYEIITSIGSRYKKVYINE